MQQFIILVLTKTKMTFSITIYITPILASLHWLPVVLGLISVVAVIGNQTSVIVTFYISLLLL